MTVSSHWRHGKITTDGVETPEIGETTAEETTTPRDSFFDGVQKSHEKKFFFRVERGMTVSHQRGNPRNPRKQAVETIPPTNHCFFSDNNNNNNNNYCHQLHTIQTTRTRKKQLCHQCDDSVVGARWENE